MSNLFNHGYALLIGVGDSAYAKWSLPVTVKDVQAIKSILANPDLCGYINDDQHVCLLHDKAATRQAILDGLNWLKNQATADGEATVVVYYSGHGWLDNSTGQYYLIQHDIEPFDIVNSALSADIFTEALRQITARRLLVIIDSCHGEGMATAKDKQEAIKLPPGFQQNALSEIIIDRLKQGEGRAIFTSSRGTQKSWIRPDGAMSIYTYHLIEALQGAGNQSGEIMVKLSHLMNYVGKAVPQSAQNLCQAEQTPFFDFATEDFAVALLRGGKGLQQEGWEAVAGDTAETRRSIEITESAIALGDNNIVKQGSSSISIGTGRDITIGDTYSTKDKQ